MERDELADRYELGRLHAAGKGQFGDEWDEVRHAMLDDIGLTSSKQLTTEQVFLVLERIKTCTDQRELVTREHLAHITNSTNQSQERIEMAFNANLVRSIDQSTVDNEGPAYPVVQWVNGSPSNKPLADVSYTGGWFMSDANCELTEPEGPMKEWSMIHRNGEQTAGYAAEGLHFGVLQTRQRWEVYEDNGQRRVFAWSGFETAKQYGRPSGRLHMLVIVKGLETYGPHIVTLRGMTGAAVTKRGGIIHQFSDKVLKAANIASVEAAQKDNAGTAPMRWPRRMFYMPISSQRSPKDWAVPTFSTVGSGNNTSQVTYPALVGIPATWEEVDLNKYFVGEEMMDTMNNLYSETDAWAHEWDSLEAGITAGKADGYDDTPSNDDAQKKARSEDDVDFMGERDERSSDDNWKEGSGIPF